MLGALALVWAACGPARAQPEVPDAADWASVQRGAAGQTVRWWMFGGDERVNRYVDQLVAPAAAELGINLVRVPVADTADAVQRVLAERRAGGAGGGVDLVWINGENFTLGKEAGLWLEGWSEALPNSRYVDWADPTIARDFGVPVEGQESPWSRAALVFAHDRRRTPEPPRSFEELLALARRHPGRVTYPAPPDFTGSAFVRLAVQTLGEERAFALLEELKPLQWQRGLVPGSEAELNRLFGDGQVDFAISYDPSFVLTEVGRGVFPESARPFVFSTGTLQNVSYVAIPAGAAHAAGALVVANLLLDPGLQAAKADPALLGLPTVLDRSRLSPAQRRLFEIPVGSPHLLEDLGPLLSEMAPNRVIAIEERWRGEVLP
ncbi:MAG: ABC transporter substrate-binding protein [Acidimicrobiia bacterium]